MNHDRPPAPAKLRLFFALWPDDATRTALAEWSRKIHRASGGRETRPETLHLTLAFLGEFDAARVRELEAAAARVRIERFVVAFDEAGYWKHNRIVWAGASRSPPELETLVAELRAALAQARVAYDPKPFVPHITLIRKARREFTLPQFEPIRWPITDFALVRSVLGSGGSEYFIQARWT